MVVVDTFSVLPVVKVLALVLLRAICIVVGALAISLAVLEFTFILLAAAVGVVEDALVVLFAVLEEAFVLEVAIRCVKLSFSAHFVLFELAFKLGSVWVIEETGAVTLIIFVFTLVDNLII